MMFPCTFFFLSAWRKQVPVASRDRLAEVAFAGGKVIWILVVFDLSKFKLKSDIPNH